MDSKQKIILAGGCFWCTEAVFKSLKGVETVTSGYAGGTIDNPTYYQVADGSSGHAESVEIVFDSNVISLKEILEVFFKLHDPTTLNKQGADIGTQYRSAIFYTNNEQIKIIEDEIAHAQKSYNEKIVTTVSKLNKFFPAEPEHKNYYLRNKGNTYCTLVIDPKIQKLKKNFKDLIR